MLLKFRLLSGDNFDLEATEKETIGEVKQKIFESKGFPVESQKLIYNDKVYENSACISELNFSENYIVVTVSTEVAENSTPIDGFSATGSAEARPSSSANVNNAEDKSNDERKKTKHRGRSHNLEYLKGNLAFQQLKNMVRESPALLPKILKQLEDYQPEIVADIRANPQVFYEMLQQPGVPQSSSRLIDDFIHNQTPSSANPMSQADREAILRLVNMGFPEKLVEEAYLVCDRNEEYAVNYILQNLNDQ